MAHQQEAPRRPRSLAAGIHRESRPDVSDPNSVRRAVPGWRRQRADSRDQKVHRASHAARLRGVELEVLPIPLLESTHHPVGPCSR